MQSARALLEGGAAQDHYAGAVSAFEYHYMRVHAGAPALLAVSRDRIATRIEAAQRGVEPRERMPMTRSSEDAEFARSVKDAANEIDLLERATAAGRSAAWRWDIGAKRALWTSSLCRLLDIEALEFDGTPASLIACFHPEDRERLSAGIAATLASTSPFECEARASHRSGEFEWLTFRVMKEHDSSGTTCLAATIVSVEARKRAEFAQREGELLFDTLFNASPLSVAISTIETGCLVDVNATFVALTGHPRQEALGRTTIELGIWPSVEDREAVVTALHEQGGVRNRIVRLRTRTAEERIGLLSAERVLFRGVPHVLTLFEDITLRERAQAALREGERRLRLALRAANAGVWQMDLSTGEIFWSDEFRDLYGYDATTPPGRETWASHLHPDDRERMLDDLRTRLRPGTDEYRREFRILHPTRGLRWILALGQIARNEQGRALSTIGISIDITRLKEVEQELRETDERKNEFLAVLSHELRNPLAPLRNGLEILRLAQGKGEIAERARTMMARQLEHMVHLIDDLLEVSRISRGKIELHRAPIDLTLALQQALEGSKPLIDAAGHDLTIDVPAGPLIVDADVIRLTQVFGNLLNNAAKYTNSGGRIWLTVERQPERVAVRIRDTGLGIPQEMLPRIFEMFAQLDSPLHRTQGGLGIGLSIARRLVEMHGGTLEAHSEGLGKGSEFVVHLPLHASAAGSSAGASPEIAQVPRTGLRVLVADDNDDAAVSLALVLEMEGHEVRTAHDGIEAVRIAESFPIDVAVLDIGMPGLDGYEVCRRLRSLPHGQDLSIIALTGWGQKEDVARSQEAGFDHHLVKPANIGALEKVLHRREVR